MEHRFAGLGEKGHKIYLFERARDPAPSNWTRFKGQGQITAERSRCHSKLAFRTHRRFSVLNDI